MSHWETIGVYEVEPRVEGGIAWGKHLVLQRLVLDPKDRRKAKGWRRHQRQTKALSRRDGDRIRSLTGHPLS